ncbi:unnamed protein product [Phytophthora fragariaefolia]|uniref:Unnamed protein product n=1 Tax=Phytophthora fragariaefolia TaxID=1490495 RepID=A0A9W7CUW7_9STRA|nr:unnamed protein product [Phytophthora fragariaefolia]
MLQELKHAGKGNTSDVERTEPGLQEFMSEADGNTALIFVDTSRDVAVAVVFQTAGIKRLFSTFPEVVMVDTTHDTNANAYKLFSFVVHDCFGKYVHHGFVERETKENLRLVVNTFLMSNPMHRRVKVLMTDKAFHEKDVLAELFPQARQRLCQFHVQQWFAKRVTRLVKGTSAEKAVVEASMSSLIRAKSEEEYKNQRALFLDLLGGNKKHPLFITFIKNWDNIQDDWAAHRRGNIPHLRNNTDNRLESKRGKIKQLLTSAYSIDKLVSALIMLQEWTEDEYIEEYNKTGSRTSIVEHPELSAFAVVVSRFAFDLVAGEFEYALSGNVRYEMSRVEDKVQMMSLRTSRTHKVDAMVMAVTVSIRVCCPVSTPV